MIVPAAQNNLNEPDVLFRQPTGQEAIGSEGAAPGDVRPIHLEDVLRFVRNVDQLRDRGLHPKGHFVLPDP